MVRADTYGLMRVQHGGADGQVVFKNLYWNLPLVALRDGCEIVEDTLTALI